MINPSASSRAADSIAASPVAQRATYDYANTARILPVCVCSICDEPFIDPCDTPCGHTFCAACLSAWAPERGCPLCRAPLAAASDLGDDKNQVIKAAVRPSQDKTLLMLLNELEVHCANKAGRCPWQGPRANLQEHLQRGCQYNACTWLARGCQWRGRLLAVAEHVGSSCEYADVACPHGPASCAHTCERRKLADHLRECPAAVKAAQEAKWKAVADVCARLNPAKADVVKLNVGGRALMCSKQTLCKYPLSLLGLLFSGNSRPLERLEDGSVFIDRNGEVFSVLLEWLRGGGGSGVDLGRLSDETRAQLCTEAAFWQLDELVALLRPTVEPPVQATTQKKKISLDQLALMLKISNTLRLVDADLSGLYLGGVKLESALFVRCSLRGTNFSGASLAASNFTASDLTDADFSGANLAGTNFTDCTLAGACLSSSTLYCVFKSCVLKATNFTGAKLESNSTFTTSDFSGALAGRCVFESCVLKVTNFTGATLASVAFLGGDVFSALWASATFRDVTFDSVPLPGADTDEWVHRTHAQCLKLGETNLELYGAVRFKNVHLGVISRSEWPANPPSWRGIHVENCHVGQGLELAGHEAYTSREFAAVVPRIRSCVGCNFANWDLRGLDLSCISTFERNALAGAVIDATTGLPTDLRGCNLSGVVFCAANFPGKAKAFLNFTGANLHGANVSALADAGFTFDFQNADLTNASLGSNRLRKK